MRVRRRERIDNREAIARLGEGGRGKGRKIGGERGREEERRRKEEDWEETRKRRAG